MKDSYILGIDIGNTNTVFGLFNSKESGILHHWRTATHRDRTSDELGIFLTSFLNSETIDRENITGFIYSSVVPSFNPVLEKMTQDYFKQKALKISYDMVPLEISYPNPSEIGADRLVNAVAAKEKYGQNLIVIDMGTATTFCILTGGTYRGGVIAPGLNLSIEALTKNTAQLPSISFEKPSSGVIGDSTIHAMQSGFFYGWAGMLKGILDEIKKSHPETKFRIIAAGGFSGILQKEIPGMFDETDPLLTLNGLQIIYYHTQKIRQ
ncbi:MAG: type III pantothenate kinase [Spirochaetia bacterium]|nr:type III pantothenate kinase [Spirochaetia bacterium]